MRQRRLMNQINVVPYIDVMLVLLVIFMVTAPMIQHGSVDLPEVSDLPPPPSEAVYVVVRTESLALQRSVSDSPQEMSNAQLRTALTELLEANPAQNVIVAADRNVSYDRVMTTLDQLRRTGFSRVSLQTQSGPGR
ncbi:ExbD/TolR family protein [Pseudazoarcus pumilus]|uniref:Protein TolR n=1 Tax=Pseudazoarcus pumilus TaxID=2067960 RepID=A0A2I6S3J0_9RHOO|nr:ExbD/TolR family protein [Pseudazoarcus pumilus]AUN93798.1 protein TolR [Pseudazoarcus pumilus]